MSLSVGVHTGLEHTSIADLRRVWRHAEDLGVDWISVWDHLTSSEVTSPDPTRARGELDGCHEAVAAHAALACSTERVRCGSLVYCAGYRHPAVLAKAITTIDHLSGGRAELGLGAGWAESEYRAFGFPFLPAGGRLDLLEETAVAVRLLLDEEVVDLSGEHVELRSARCDPRPLQAHVPIWIGGGGERRTLRIVARHADGWNVAFVSPAALAHKHAVLRDHCEAVGRSPAAVRCSVNVGVAADEADLRARFGRAADAVRPAVLTGSAGEMADRIGAYAQAGADQINLAVRAPWDPDLLERAVDAADSVSSQVG